MFIFQVKTDATKITHSYLPQNIELLEPKKNAEY